MGSMHVCGSADVGGFIAKVRLHPRLPRLAGLARTAATDEVLIWQIEADGRLTELVHRAVSASADPGESQAEPSMPQQGMVRDVAFHPHRDWLAVVKHEVPVEFWQLPQGSLLKHLGSARADNAIAFSPTGRWVVFSSRPPALRPAEDYCRSAQLYDLESETQTILDWETDTTFAFHPGERVLAGGWNDQGGGMIRFLELPFSRGRGGHDFDAPGWVDGLTFGPEGNTLAVMGGAGWDGHFCLEVHDFTSTSYPSCRRRFVREWQAPDAEEKGWEVPWTERVVFSPDGSRLVHPGPCGELIEVDVRTGVESQRWRAHDRMVTTLDVEPRRSLLASGGRDGRVLLWEA
jgi:WD40 repeat protein